MLCQSSNSPVAYANCQGDIYSSNLPPTPNPTNYPTPNPTSACTWHTAPSPSNSYTSTNNKLWDLKDVAWIGSKCYDGGKGMRRWQMQWHGTSNNKIKMEYECCGKGRVSNVCETKNTAVKSGASTNLYWLKYHDVDCGAD